MVSSAVLQADVSKCIAPHFNSMHGDMDRVAQVFVAPFSKEQTDTYVKKFADSKELNLDDWSAAQFQAALDANPEVAGLASSPLMLFMVLTILPSPPKMTKIRQTCWLASVFFGVVCGG